MLRLFRVLAVSLLVALPSTGVFGQTTPIDVRSNGQDGVFSPTADITIDLTNAIEGIWDADYTPAQAALAATVEGGLGVYDSSRWAVVFHYQSVNIPAGVTVTFESRPGNPPVVWLVQSDAVIDGTVNLNGIGQTSALPLKAPPGGFRGGFKYGTAGFGPGSGNQASGSFATAGSQGGTTYGNPSLLPLIGGSGGGVENPGGAPTATPPHYGGSGGGAILIACGNQILLNGQITARGGNGSTQSIGPTVSRSSRPGSGGGVRLVCSSLDGSGSITCIGGTNGGTGGLGRIRLESQDPSSNSPLLILNPEPSVVAVDPVPPLWIQGDDGTALAPAVRILSVGGEPVPSDPAATFGAPGADVTLAEGSDQQVIIEVTNLDAAEAPTLEVRLRVTKRTGGGTSYLADYDVANSGGFIHRYTVDVPGLTFGTQGLIVSVRR